MNFKKLITIYFFIALLGGCATSVTTTGSYDGLAVAETGKATIYVYRESSLGGMANQYDVLVDDKLVGSLPNGSFFVVTTSAGEKLVKADTGMGDGSTITVEGGKVYCMRLTLNFNLIMKSANINPVSKAQCDKEMKSLDEVKLK